MQAFSQQLRSSLEEVQQHIAKKRTHAENKAEKSDANQKKESALNKKLDSEQNKTSYSTIKLMCELSELYKEQGDIVLAFDWRKRAIEILLQDTGCLNFFTLADLLLQCYLLLPDELVIENFAEVLLNLAETSFSMSDKKFQNYQKVKGAICCVYLEHYLKCKPLKEDQLRDYFDRVYNLCFENWSDNQALFMLIKKLINLCSCLNKQSTRDGVFPNIDLFLFIEQLAGRAGILTPQLPHEKYWVIERALFLKDILCQAILYEDLYFKAKDKRNLEQFTKLIEHIFHIAGFFSERNPCLFSEQKIIAAAVMDSLAIDCDDVDFIAACRPLIAQISKVLSWLPIEDAEKYSLFQRSSALLQHWSNHSTGKQKMTQQAVSQKNNKIEKKEPMTNDQEKTIKALAQTLVENTTLQEALELSVTQKKESDAALEQANGELRALKLELEQIKSAKQKSDQENKKKIQELEQTAEKLKQSKQKELGEANQKIQSFEKGNATLQKQRDEVQKKLGEIETLHAEKCKAMESEHQKSAAKLASVNKLKEQLGSCVDGIQARTTELETALEKTKTTSADRALATATQLRKQHEKLSQERAQALAEVSQLKESIAQQEAQLKTQEWDLTALKNKCQSYEQATEAKSYPTETFSPPASIRPSAPQTPNYPASASPRPTMPHTPSFFTPATPTPWPPAQQTQNHTTSTPPYPYEIPAQQFFLNQDFPCLRPSFWQLSFLQGPYGELVPTLTPTQNTFTPAPVFYEE